MGYVDPGNGLLRSRKRGKNACYPLFSAEDADLSLRYWRLDRKGYARGTCGGLARYAHQLVMFRIRGRWHLPNEQCDHLNHNPLDNRRENLRAVTPKQNSENLLPRGALPRGVTRYGDRFVAAVVYNYRRLHLGIFDSIEDAERAAKSKRKELGFHGE